MENLLFDYIIGEALIMILALWVLGYIIKVTDAVNSKYIPILLLGVSLCTTPWLLGGLNADNLIQAVLVAGGAVFSDQLVKQLGITKKEQEGE